MNSYTVEIASIEHDRFGSVDDTDRARAVEAGTTVLREAGVSAAAAEAAYRAQWEELDDEGRMHGPALAWIAARQAADAALTATWANPAAEVFCTLRAAGE